MSKCRYQRSETRQIYSTKQLADFARKVFLQNYCPSADVCNHAQRALKDQSILGNIIAMSTTQLSTREQSA